MSMPEKRHTRISTNLTTLQTISFSHPFTQQIDAVFPSECLELEHALSALKTRYARGRVELAKVFAAGFNFVHPYGSLEHTAASSSNQTQHASELVAVGMNHAHGTQNDDVWCVDTRGVLTICVCKETYERLGLVGQKVPFKHQSGERYVISLPLHDNAESVPVQTRRRSALESWDANFILNINATRTKIEGGPGFQGPTNGVWEVVYCSTAPVGDNSTDYLDKWASQIPILTPVITQVTCEKSYLENVWIPNPASLPPRPQPRQEEEFEDWQHDVSALFEWVGMTGLHAQRLQANDRVDPYVAIYEPPTASRVGNVTHLRWRGLLSPAFVQSVIDASVEFLQSGRLSPSSFVAITVHGITNSPVVYLPQPRTEKAESSSTAATPNPPAHLPRRDGEDTWSLVLAPTEEEGKDLKSVLYECVGQWDARWG